LIGKKTDEDRGMKIIEIYNKGNYGFIKWKQSIFQILKKLFGVFLHFAVHECSFELVTED